MTTEWPPPPDAKSSRLLAEVDSTEMPHAAPFSACLEALASSTEVFAWIPCIGNVNGRPHEVHPHGVANREYGPSSIPVATPEDYQNAAMKPEFISTVLEHVGASAEHFMAFAEVLSGQDLNMGGAAPSEEQEGYVTPIDWAYYNLAFHKGGTSGSASGEVKESLADFAELRSASSAVSHTIWSGTGKDAAVRKFDELENFLLHIRAPMHAEFGATLVAYAALVKAARKQLDGIMAQAVAAMRRLEASGGGDIVATVALLLTLVGFLPGLPYALSFGVAAASAVVSEIESRAKAEDAPDITIPGDRRNSCVDILRWYLDEARATCEGLSDGVTKLTKRLGELLDQVMHEVPGDEPVPAALNGLPG